MKKIFSLVATVLMLSSCTTTYYYVVRHAERLNNSANTPLSAAGLSRAQVLSDSLSSKNISLIFASIFLRTQQTAQPTATAKGLPLILYNADTTAGLITRLKKIKGKSVLVTGHSDNVPAIVLGLSNQSVSPIPSNDFDNFYIIRVRNYSGTRRILWHRTYGNPSP